jgi:hypothetical protein
VRLSCRQRFIPKPPPRRSPKHVVHLVKNPVQHAHHEVARTLRRHVYVAPKSVAHAKVAVVCTVIGVGGGLGAGIAAGGDPISIFEPVSHVVQAQGEPSRITQSGPPVQVPEPSSLVLLASAGMGLALIRRRARSPVSASYVS